MLLMCRRCPSNSPAGPAPTIPTCVLRATFVDRFHPTRLVVLAQIAFPHRRSYFGGSTLIVAVGPTPAVRIHIGSFPDPS